jgi:hypothetical protein
MMTAKFNLRKVLLSGELFMSMGMNEEFGKFVLKAIDKYKKDAQEAMWTKYYEEVLDKKFLFRLISVKGHPSIYITTEPDGSPTVVSLLTEG